MLPFTYCYFWPLHPQTGHHHHHYYSETINKNDTWRINSPFKDVSLLETRNDDLTYEVVISLWPTNGGHLYPQSWICGFPKSSENQRNWTKSNQNQYAQNELKMYRLATWNFFQINFCKKSRTLMSFSQRMSIAASRFYLRIPSKWG